MDQVGPVVIDGAYMKTCFDFRRTRKIAGIKNNVYEVSAVTHVYGVGYSYVEIHEKTIDMHARLWVLATPVDGTLVELVLVSQMHEIRNPRRPVAGLTVYSGEAAPQADESHYVVGRRDGMFYRM